MKDIKKKVILLFIVIFLFSSKIIYKEKQNKDNITLDKINEYNVLVKGYVSPLRDKYGIKTTTL